MSQYDSYSFSKFYIIYYYNSESLRLCGKIFFTFYAALIGINAYILKLDAKPNL